MRASPLAESMRGSCSRAMVIACGGTDGAGRRPCGHSLVGPCSPVRGLCASGHNDRESANEAGRPLTWTEAREGGEAVRAKDPQLPIRPIHLRPLQSKRARGHRPRSVSGAQRLFETFGRLLVWGALKGYPVGRSAVRCRHRGCPWLVSGVRVGTRFCGQASSLVRPAQSPLRTGSSVQGARSAK